MHLKQRAGDGGITVENMEKSQHTDFNEDTTNESASVAFSNIRLWNLDSQKEWRNTFWRLWDERTVKDSAGFVDNKENKWVGSQQSWIKEGTVRHRRSKEASIRWSYHEETRELPEERDNARNNARCTQERKATHGLDGRHQDVDRTLRGRVNQVRPWCGHPSDRGRLKVQYSTGVPIWDTLSIRHCLPLSIYWPLCANITSSIKPDIHVHNVSQRCQRRTESRP